MNREQGMVTPGVKERPVLSRVVCVVSVVRLVAAVGEGDGGDGGPNGVEGAHDINVDAEGSGDRDVVGRSEDGGESGRRKSNQTTAHMFKIIRRAELWLALSHGGTKKRSFYLFTDNAVV